jgi:DNA polymerase beta
MGYNKLIIDIFTKMSIIEKSNRFKYDAYIRAINIIQNYNKKISSSSDIKDYYLNQYRIGDKLLLKIDEIIQTSTLQELDKYTNKVNSINNLTHIMGIGSKKANDLISLGINSINDLQSAYKNKSISLTHEQLLGIKYYKDLQQKIPHRQIDIFKKIINSIKDNINSKLILTICGSYRRQTLQSGDIDVLISYKVNDNYIEQFIKALSDQSILVDTISIGQTKYSGLIKIPNKKYVRRLDIRFIPLKSYYTALLYYTGNREFNIFMRQKAIQLGYSLSEYRLYNKKTNKNIPINSEKDIFKKLHMNYINPQDRQ